MVIVAAVRLRKVPPVGWTTPTEPAIAGAER